MVGFHTARWATNFLRGCADLTDAAVDLGTGTVRFRDGRTAVLARPISVDPVEFDRLKDDERAVSEEERILETQAPSSCPPCRPDGPVEERRPRLPRLRAAPGAHPELLGRVQMLALLDPSRQDIPEYAEYLGAIQRDARHVNDRFQRNGWTPLELRIEDNFPQAVAAYKQYDVLLVNAIFDGMNLSRRRPRS